DLQGHRVALRPADGDRGVDRDRPGAGGSHPASGLASRSMIRFLTAGESHGPGLVTIVEGLPKGLQIGTDDFAAELARRRRGYGQIGRMTIEMDEGHHIYGGRHGRTTKVPC